MNVKRESQLVGVILASFVFLPPDVTYGGELTGHIVGKPLLAEGSRHRPVIWVEGAEGAAVPMVSTVITHLSGKLEPAVSIGYVGRDFVFRNDDQEFHNTHLCLHLEYQKRTSRRPLHYGATIYNVPLPAGGNEIRKPIKPYHRYRKETGHIEVVCNPHPGEKAYVMVFDHPYCDVAGEDGSFSITGVPPGRYPVLVLFEGEVREAGEAVVLEGEATVLDLNLD